MDRRKEKLLNPELQPHLLYHWNPSSYPQPLNHSKVVVVDVAGVFLSTGMDEEIIMLLRGRIT
jgi:hypothetical protein